MYLGKVKHGKNKYSECHCCRKKGHARAECRKRLKDEQGKSGANAVQDSSGSQAAAVPKAFEWVLALSAVDVTDASEDVAVEQPY